ncbi:zinc ribbon-containing protein [Thalassomonas sp. M1454]|uniref:zinc ribbon-containing protein n=1 Tax=Thalassomonas sp. M1454 TaxID=2594477 RepID=UPI00117E9058|nr:hypothetical protein [Thalassomonas sp. M1454]TRX57358.1 hypothetical protein FNN08_07640 [Thalassomonas sp. M1454]
MAKANPEYQSVFDQIYDWLKQAKKDEVAQIMNWVEKANEYIKAAEAISVNEFQLSVDDFKRDLFGFHHNSQPKQEQSLYLQSVKEGMWQHLADMTDQSQVEWSELLDDFEHDGIYKTGDAIGFGQLECQQCGQSVDILHASTVTSCITCAGNEFKRKPLK